MIISLLKYCAVACVAVAATPATSDSQVLCALSVNAPFGVRQCNNALRSFIAFCAFVEGPYHTLASILPFDSILEENITWVNVPNFGSA